MNNLLYSLMMASDASETAQGGFFQKYWLIIVMGVLIVAMVVMTIIPNKRRQKEYQRMQNGIRPGTKIMTIGRMIGTVVRVYDNNTLEVDVGTPGAPVIMTISREAVSVNLDEQAAQQAGNVAPAAAAPAATEAKADEAAAPAETASDLPQEQSEIPEEKSELPVEGGETIEEPKKATKKDDYI